MNNTLFNPMVTAYKKPVYRHFNLHDNGHKLPVNILEGDNRFIIEMAVPGFDKSEISISLEGGKLTVKGQKSPDNEIKYLRREWTASNFERSFILSENADPEKAEATTVSGVLRIMVPKKEKKAPHTVVVK